MRKTLLAGLNAFQVKATRIIEEVHGPDSAQELAEKYRRHNLEDIGEEFGLDEIVPLPAKCSKCKRNWIGKDAIRAPHLDIARCFYCGGQLVAHPKEPPVESAFDRRRRLEREAMPLFASQGKSP